MNQRRADTDRSHVSSRGLARRLQARPGNLEAGRLAQADKLRGLRRVQAW
nr:hypothetical protein [Streptomyces abyssomicinicus]